ncbi:MAG: hypothetical protein ACI89J_001671 [Hyphomicrobiaceae bacterium]|jgi:hypothetical protein
MMVAKSRKLSRMYRMCCVACALLIDQVPEFKPGSDPLRSTLRKEALSSIRAKHEMKPTNRHVGLLADGNRDLLT